MEYYKYLKELENINPSNEFLSYITERVLDKDYRGYQCSQHNRLTFDYFSNLISIIYEIAGDNIFDIHIGDDTGELQPQASTYYKIVTEVKKMVGKGTINSVKKNTFPDIARMGFLNRYDKNGILINESGGRKGVYSVGLSKIGVKFASTNAFEKIKIFTDGIDKLTKNTASELVEFLYLNDYGINSIDILEYMYILSDDRDSISFNDKMKLLIEYRKLNHIEKQKVDYYLKAFCNPNNRKGLANKTLLRDYSNWKNESQQIYGLLANSTYFKVEDNKLILNTGTLGLFDETTIRSSKGKSEYFKKHNIIKNNDYELHHIVPFSKAQNKNDTLYIDDYKNFIYLRKNKHAEFTNSLNKNVILKYTSSNPNLLFLNFNDEFIIVNIDKKDALLSVSLLPQMKKYNEELIRKFYYL